MFPIDIDFSRLLEAFKYNPDAPMIFSSGIFLWLFAAFMVIYTLLQHRNTARILFVALFSYYFYYKSSGTYFFPVGYRYCYRFCDSLADGSNRCPLET